MAGSCAKLMKLLNIFLDASVILSGLGSVTGGSRKILEAGRSKKFRLFASRLVISEVGAHLSKVKVPSSELLRIVENKTIQVVETPPLEFILKFTSLTLDPNDAHVLAGAVISGSDLLISLDKKHILTRKVKRFLSPIKVYSPKQFWRYLSHSKRRAGIRVLSRLQKSC